MQFQEKEKANEIKERKEHTGFIKEAAQEEVKKEARKTERRAKENKKRKEKDKRC